MYKLYIVDDEPYVIDGLLACVDWEKHGISVVGTATDGATAYQDILDMLPDIVITDIKMPAKNGIDLINEVHYQLPHINFIIFSCYNDFHYAREAILANAVDFLVKPSSTDEILHAVTLAVTARTRHVFQNKIDFHSPDYRKLLKGIFLNPVPEIYGEGYYYVIMMDTLEVSTLTVHAKEIDITAGDLNLHVSFINFFDRQMAIVASLEAVKEENGEEIIAALRNNLTAYFTLEGDFVMLGISNANKLHNLKEGYQEALEAIDYCKFFSYPQERFSHIRYQDIDISKLDFWDKIGSTIRQKDLESFLAALKDQFSAFKDWHISKASLKEFCLKAYLLISDDILNHYNINPILELGNLKTLEDSFIYLSTLYRNHFETTQAQRLNAQNKFIQKVILFIQAHYQEPLSLNDAAEYTRKSTGYISSKFKKEVGISFPQYVTDYRLLKARNLLITTNLKVKEIALMVGFSDEQYFSLVFKKECGMTPGTYRKIYQPKA